MKEISKQKINTEAKLCNAKKVGRKMEKVVQKVHSLNNLQLKNNNE